MHNLKDIMTCEVEVLSPDAMTADATVPMVRLDVGSIPVCDGERLNGMRTDRDLAVRVMASGREPEMTRIKEVMTDALHYCYEDEYSAEAARSDVGATNMATANPVEIKQLVGIVSWGDLAVKGRDTTTSGTVLKYLSS